MEKIIQLVKKHKQIILYLIFGVLSTLINILAYWVFAHPLSINTVWSTTLAWLVAVFFAFFTNKVLVFESALKNRFFKELGGFLLARALTGVLDIAIMYVFVDVLALNDMVIKIISNVIVIVLNYVFSKFMIFKKDSGGNDDEGASK